jgi:flagellar biosynthetic protein FlhB
MADNNQDKTEQPTRRRLEQAREKGQVAFSADLTSGLALLAATMYLWLLGPQLIGQLENDLRDSLSSVPWQEWSAADSQQAIIRVFKVAVVVAFPLVAMSLVIGVSSALLQTGIRISLEPLQLKPEKLDPAKGFGRLFSVKAVTRGAMAIGKVSLICAALYWLYLQRIDSLSVISGASMRQTIGVCLQLTAELALVGAALLTLIGITDFGFQKWQFMRDMRMSRQELVDENKESEGDPHLKARMRRLQREARNRKGLQEVKTATMVVRNPTHFAVALKYDRESMDAPRVVAKGKDLLALKIIDLATVHRVPIFENKPLARTLFQTVEVDQAIPIELYAAVAELMSYVYSLNKSRPIA